MLVFWWLRLSREEMPCHHQQQEEERQTSLSCLKLKGLHDYIILLLLGFKGVVSSCPLLHFTEMMKHDVKKHGSTRPYFNPYL